MPEPHASHEPHKSEGSLLVPIPVVSGGGRWHLALAFALPILLMGGVFALHGVFPAGDRQILVTDYWQQYYPLFSDCWHRLREGGSLLWSWRTGGSAYLPVAAALLGNPLHLAALLAPHAWLREALTATLLLKLGLAGLSLCAYLRHASGRREPLAVAFSTAYALCGHTLGDYWNLLWMDALVLLPLVIWGLERLLRENKQGLYVAALALAVLCNWRAAIPAAGFALLWLLVCCVTDRVDFSTLWRRLGQYLLYTTLAAGLTGVLTVPALLASGPRWDLHLGDTLYEGLAALAGSFAAFAEPADQGLPSLYSGLLGVMAFPVFLRARGERISGREKLALSLLLAAVLVLCCRGLPFGPLGYLISFVVAAAAYRGCATLEDLDPLDFVGMALFGGGVALAAYFGPQARQAVWGSLVFLALYLLLFLLYHRGALRPAALSLVLVAVVALEAGGGAWVGVNTVQTTARSVYPDADAEVQALLAGRTPNADSPARTEMTRWFTLNDPSLYQYDGLSLYGPGADPALTRFWEELGLPAWQEGERRYYGETSPLANALLGVRYLVSRDGAVADTTYWTPIAQEGESLLLENRRSLPLGFLAGQWLDGLSVGGATRFETQNRIFAAATGLEGELFSLVDVVHAGHRNYRVYRNDLGRYTFTADSGGGGLLKWNYEIPLDGAYYAYVEIQGAGRVELLQDNELLQAVDIRRPYLFPLGEYRMGDTISLQAALPPDVADGTAVVQVAQFYPELFDAGWELLSATPLRVEVFDGTVVQGTVDAPRDSLLYTSIPAAPGWSAWVDGRPAEIHPLGDALITLRVPAGSHTVELRYRPPGLSLGMAVSGGSLLALLLLLFLRHRANQRELLELWRRINEASAG